MMPPVRLAEMRARAGERAALKCEAHTGITAHIVDGVSIVGENIPGVSALKGGLAAVGGAVIGAVKGEDPGKIATNFATDVVVAAAGLSPVPGTGTALREGVHEGARAAGVPGKYVPDASATGDALRRRQLCP
jgi:hypothetical protein